MALIFATLITVRVLRGVRLYSVIGVADCHRQYSISPRLRTRDGRAGARSMSGAQCKQGESDNGAAKGVQHGALTNQSRVAIYTLWRYMSNASIPT
ncbi:MAG: hypothetical protein FP825_17090 [Hyphomonas sp.]|uniref:hypothetical protein n=1 Tax=Hyphomonas sp. TaxID=87 RepID=UPI0005F11B8D|nr:hypothetical protein [Hyphomonas sp.]KJS28049.1 MAG: hypothetical protein VR75_00760 [Hyphomonadaceae bacterium BRH_c29]MBA3070186.1 hypothetical protein [Hyphomonas sp.]MBU4060238.1 hypothetical protein [Alphaproteobacteria bacterium]MBU4162906.1 hypothetical protein [Alphaproteobacteria bacterium]